MRRRVIRGALAGAVLAGLATTVWATAWGSAARPTGGDPAAGYTVRAATLAITVNRRGFGAIWVMDANGKGRTRLTERGSYATDASGSTSPAWSPDGERIAYSSSGTSGVEDERDLEIYVMDADGTNKRPLTNDDVINGTPAWSPDGTRIAFAHIERLGSADADGVIMTMNTEGGDRVQLTRHEETRDVVFDTHPAWSPDGARIAFTRAAVAPNGSSRVAIYTIDRTGADERVLIGDAGEPAYSPDGTAMAFTSIRDRFGETCFHECSPSGEIYVARADGTGLRRLTKSRADDHSPAWSPDGTRLAFVSDRSNRWNHEVEIYVVGVDGRGLRRITTNDVWDLEPDWRSHGGTADTG